MNRRFSPADDAVEHARQILTGRCLIVYFFRRILARLAAAQDGASSPSTHTTPDASASARFLAAIPKLYRHAVHKHYSMFPRAGILLGVDDISTHIQRRCFAQTGPARAG